MYSLIRDSSCLGGGVQYVLYYIAQVISGRLPSEHDLLQARARVSLKRRGPGVD